ncbi:hypothetical protein EDEG_01857 [Edhazardia aedis USNM 41457]|uniref:Uncharacterized protein n=1 Tax=Edhazardia aedis (strain USNM 41457) TaxID=1003232 RepID=J8ZW05_EDHAE|nr:hypothetical protein EDEG_01857 [Edhazardia aedis USNM 41457]|eukprot:EJW03858.1 hypothetical protein EDEG_01857 [Edhazardia aedis USNM 41457]
MVQTTKNVESNENKLDSLAINNKNKELKTQNMKTHTENKLDFDLNKIYIGHIRNVHPKYGTYVKVEGRILHMLKSETSIEYITDIVEFMNRKFPRRIIEGVVYLDESGKYKFSRKRMEAMCDVGSDLWSIPFDDFMINCHEIDEKKEVFESEEQNKNKISEGVKINESMEQNTKNVLALEKTNFESKNSVSLQTELYEFNKKENIENIDHSILNKNHDKSLIDRKANEHTIKNELANMDLSYIPQTNSQFKKIKTSITQPNSEADHPNTNTEAIQKKEEHNLLDLLTSIDEFVQNEKWSDIKILLHKKILTISKLERNLVINTLMKMIILKNGCYIDFLKKYYMHLNEDDFLKIIDILEIKIDKDSIKINESVMNEIERPVIERCNTILVKYFNARSKKKFDANEILTTLKFINSNFKSVLILEKLVQYVLLTGQDICEVAITFKKQREIASSLKIIYNNSNPRLIVEKIFSYLKNNFLKYKSNYKIKIMKYWWLEYLYNEEENVDYCRGIYTRISNEEWNSEDAKFFFKKWLDFEKKNNGDVEYVKNRAKKYVETYFNKLK